EGRGRWGVHWVSEPGNRRLVESVLERVRSSGPVRSSDFERDGPRRGSWWDWKPAKRALEHLYNKGDLMVADRVNFQRVYDLAERVLPPWVDIDEPTEAEASRYLLERSMRALGICDPRQVPDYMGLKRTEARPFVEQLVKDGTFVPVNARLASGEVKELVIHRENLPRLEQAADGSLVPRHVTFLSPFDNLFWAKGRDVQFWGFEQVLEAYKPRATRRWGYFCMPILIGDRLVGRIDPKLDRSTRTLRLVSVYLEPDVPPNEELVALLAGALRGGAGLVDVAAAEGVAPVIAAAEPSYLTIPLAEDDAGRICFDAQSQIETAVGNCTAVAVGPGCGQSDDLDRLICELFTQVDKPMVVDADALNALAKTPDVLSRGPAARILTPHPGEFARLTGTDVTAIGQNREETAARFARDHNVILVLKGQGTVITDGRQLAVNTTGNSGMATGGSGKVMEEAWYFIFTMHAKEQKPILEHRLIQFLQERGPYSRRQPLRPYQPR
ncbi:MAG: winged helix DNA-binding domain-containing protein, partial [Chloroflexi bacterium]|nr:winged helix DNA-binding domain-containing protein [Chloroflexota bacterium]